MAMPKDNGGFSTRNGGSRRTDGAAIVWFRNDLRLHDNEVLLRAFESRQMAGEQPPPDFSSSLPTCPSSSSTSSASSSSRSSAVVVPLYCFDPRQFSSTHNFGFPKTGGFRAQFLLEAVADLRQALRERGSELLVRVGIPELVIPQIAQAVGATEVFAQKETTEEEVKVERNLLLKLRAGGGGRDAEDVALHLLWGSTLYHIDDLPFRPAMSCPDIYTQFRKTVESRCEVRPPLPTTSRMLPGLPPVLLAAIGGAGDLPDAARDLGVEPLEQDSRGVLKFRGGESAALSRLRDYFWAKDLLRTYKQTRNGMLGADYSSKFSPWLAHGCISPRLIHSEVLRYEKERVANESTYWLLFELMWRDYFRFLSMKCGNSIFKPGGPRNVQGQRWSTDRSLFDAWRTGSTGYPLVDANMRELLRTGWMSNRGRQIVCSFLVREMGLDWRMGAEWFESLLLDYDPCSNYGNWTYGAGVGTDPREDRYFSIPKQAQSYDPNANYVLHWLPELAHLPRDRCHSAYQLSPSERAAMAPDYPPPVVRLKAASPGIGGGSRRKGPPTDISRRQSAAGGSEARKGAPFRF